VTNSNETQPQESLQEIVGTAVAGVGPAVEAARLHGEVPIRGAKRVPLSPINAESLDHRFMTGIFNIRCVGAKSMRPGGRRLHSVSSNADRHRAKVRSIPWRCQSRVKKLGQSPFGRRLILPNRGCWSSFRPVFIVACLLLGSACRAAGKSSDQASPRPAGSVEGTRKPVAFPSVRDSSDKKVQLSGIVVPRAGGYRYELTPVGASASDKQEFELDFGEPVSVGKGRYRQIVERRQGQQAIRRQTLVWKSDGLYLLRESWVFSDGESPPCEFDPILLVLRFPIAPNSTWESKAQCGGPQLTIERTLKANVLGEETAETVDGMQVTAVKIREVELQSTAGSRTGAPGTGSTTDERTYWFSLANGLRIRVHGSGTSGSTRAEREERIFSLVPN
jgi:hypothetical protein